MINELRERFTRPREKFEHKGRFPKQAAVLLAVTNHAQKPEIILTQRADHLSTHSGEVSFPGGKWEEIDETLIDTALRETHEEIGLPGDQVDIINVLPPQMSLWGLKVSPYVGIVPHQLDLTPDLNELDSIFRVPLKFFLADERTRTEVYQRHDSEWWSPVYHYEGYKIWGLTARILVDFVNMAWGANVTRKHDAPELVR